MTRYKLPTIALVLSTILLSACGGSNKTSNNEVAQPSLPEPTIPEPETYTFSAQFKSLTRCGTTLANSDFSLLIYDQDWHKLKEIIPDGDGDVTFTSEHAELNIIKLIDTSPQTTPVNWFATVIEGVPSQDHGLVLTSDNSEQSCSCETRDLYFTVPDDFYQDGAEISIHVPGNAVVEYTFDGQPLNVIPTQKICKPENGNYPETPVFVNSKAQSTDPNNANFIYTGMMAASIDFDSSENNWLAMVNLPAQEHILNDINELSLPPIVRNFTHWRKSLALTSNLTGNDFSVLSYDQHLNKQDDLHLLDVYNPIVGVNLPGIDLPNNKFSYFYEQKLTNNIYELLDVNLPEPIREFSYQQQMVDLLLNLEQDYQFDFSGAGYNYGEIELLAYLNDKTPSTLKDSVRIHYYGPSASTLPIQSILAPELTGLDLSNITGWHLAMGAIDVTNKGNYQTDQAIFLTGGLSSRKVGHKGLINSSYSISIRD
ncbi:hypothetical protein tinsulaeT_11050 [Thalassotalea insulae]|uniref:Uncharacterized protein n=1 Tax=Thalassotalea insulae TaxID=2056778 RepID=A0ABQ6GSV5_9GAMM|nr:hypothetical protein [Thalassotalea insulae]GLX77765.1 hypothetical protein tinsulaeT_11050 [Thalassotalea insulae]